MRRQLRLALGMALFGWCVVRSVRRLMASRQVLRRAQRIVVMPEGGFGHTITGPDVMRRMYKGERLFFIVFERHPHNPYVGLLWTDVDLLFLPLRCRVPGRSYDWAAPLALREWVARVLIEVLRRCTSADVMSLAELYDRLAATRYIESLMAPWPRYTSYWMPAWNRLLGGPGIPRARLPERLRAVVRAKIARFARLGEPGSEVRTCCLYLRAKGVPGGEMSSLNRSSGPLENYLPAIEYLAGAGYLVLVTGDRPLPQEWASTLGGVVVCAEWVGVEPRVFSLFAHTEADVWIGQQGGPCVLPVINGTPMLVVDAFPFGNALPNAWMHYKTVRDADGRLVHYTRLFAEYAYDYAPAGLLDNSAEEILEAVREFVEWLGRPLSADATRAVLGAAPDYVLTKHVDCRLSPSWLRLFGNGHDPLRIPRGSVTRSGSSASPSR